MHMSYFLWLRQMGKDVLLQIKNNRWLALGVVCIILVPSVIWFLSNTQSKIVDTRENLVWQSAEELIEKKQIEAPSKILEVSLSYDSTSTPQFHFSSLRILDGYTPKYVVEEKDYYIQTIDAKGNVLEQIGFTEPSAPLMAPPEEGSDQRHEYPIGVISQAFNFKYDPLTAYVRIIEANKKPLISIEIKQAKQIHNNIDFEVLEEKDSLSESFINVLAKNVMAQSGRQVRVLFISQRYNGDYGKFRNDIETLRHHLSSFEPFQSRFSQFWFARIETEADLQCGRGQDGLGRLMICNQGLSIQEANNRQAAYDKIVVLVNDPGYGGGAWGVGGVVSVATNGRTKEQVFVHEFGHSMGLYDEYNYSNTIGNASGVIANCYAGDPNALISHPNWRGISSSDLKRGCNIPDFYRSSETSIMHAIDIPYFNLVSQRVLSNTINQIAGVNDEPEPTQVPTPTTPVVPTPTPTPGEGDGSCGARLTCSYSQDRDGEAICFSGSGGSGFNPVGGCRYVSDCSQQVSCPTSGGTTPTPTPTPDGGGGNTCRDNPETPMSGYTWKASCGGRVCGSNGDCPKNDSLSEDLKRNSAWCYAFPTGNRCLQLQSRGGNGGAIATSTPVPGGNGAPSCNRDAVNMSVSSQNNAVGGIVSLTVNGSQGSTFPHDSISPSGANCSFDNAGGFWNTTATCTFSRSGAYAWTHEWKNCATNNCGITSTQCSKSLTITISDGGSSNACRDLAPSQTTPSSASTTVTDTSYVWKAISCGNPCNGNNSCPKNDSLPANLKDTSAWCYGFEGGGRCLQLQAKSGGGGSPSCTMAQQAPDAGNACVSCIKNQRGGVNDIKALFPSGLNSCSDGQLINGWCNGGVSNASAGDCARIKSGACSTSCGGSSGVQPTNTPIPTSAASARGDIDRNGVVDLKDIFMCNKEKNRVITSVQCDLNGDGVVTDADIIRWFDLVLQ